MKYQSLTSGPFRKWPFFEPQELEREASKLLQTYQLLPESPMEIDVASLVQPAFGFSPDYRVLDEDVMGYVEFGDHQAEGISINEQLAEFGNVVTERRCRSTLGHECAHAYLHSPYFCELKRSLQNPAAFGEMIRPGEALKHQRAFRTNRNGNRAQAFIICRSGTISDEASARFTTNTYAHLPAHERMAEWQANRFMACLLVPARLARRLMAEVLEARDDGFSVPQLNPVQRKRLAAEMSRVFNVSRQLAQTRISELFPVAPEVVDLFSLVAKTPFRPFIRPAGERD